MPELNRNMKAELVCIIVNDGMAERILKYARTHGMKGGTIMLGKGTVNNKILDFFGLADIRKEIIYLLGEQDTAIRVAEEISEKFQFKKPNHGIAFTTPVCDIVGSRNIVCDFMEDEKNMDPVKYHIINVIVDKGKAEVAIAAAERAGSKGGTIINARGAGVHETSRVFAMDIEPEKEIVLILSEVADTDRIVEAMAGDLDIASSGNGIIYVQNANRTYGIFR